MCRSLEERGYKLRGLNAFPDIPAQTARYKDLGYSGGVSVCDMNDVYYKVLPRSLVTRCERLELFDELEEWHLMSAHYCIAVAVNEVTFSSSNRGASGGGGSSSSRSAVDDDGMPIPAPRVPRTQSILSHAGGAERAAGSSSSSSSSAGFQPGAWGGAEHPSSWRGRRLSGLGIAMGGESETSDAESISSASARSQSRQRLGGASSPNQAPAAILKSHPSALDGHSDTFIIHSHRSHSHSASSGGGGAVAGAEQQQQQQSPAGAPHRSSRSKESLRGKILVSGSLDDAPDFTALAEAEEEIGNARKARETAGIDAEREGSLPRPQLKGTEAAGAAASSSGGGGGRASWAAQPVQPPQPSDAEQAQEMPSAGAGGLSEGGAYAAAAAVTATATAAAPKPAPSGAPGSGAAAPLSRGSLLGALRSYETTAVSDASKAKFTLLDMLLPVTKGSK
jgi:hypothetical protein